MFCSTMDCPVSMLSVKATPAIAETIIMSQKYNRSRVPMRRVLNLQTASVILFDMVFLHEELIVQSAPALSFRLRFFELGDKGFVGLGQAFHERAIVTNHREVSRQVCALGLIL
ncbi:hypothetical protein AMA2_14 [Achromobacter phage AMA2]|nr:hypothetical protein AMA2_14 [Achromobacter phage AMA2]